MEVKEAIRVPCVYFAKPGVQNTYETFEIAKQRAQELGIKYIVLASTKGDTALKAVRFFEGYGTIVVTHAHGFRDPGVQEVPDESLRAIREAGGVVYTGTHVFAAAGRAIRKKFQTYQSEEIIANTLRMFGQGMKVVCEIVMMAADAGLVPTDGEVIAIAGTGRGADTAVVIRPVNTQDLFDLRVAEILCKPRFWVTPNPSRLAHGARSADSTPMRKLEGDISHSA